MPVEYPSTRHVGASAEERANDLNAAFADPDIKAVMAVIGGDDQITVLPHLDADTSPPTRRRTSDTRTTPTSSTSCGTSTS